MIQNNFFKIKQSVSGDQNLVSGSERKLIKKPIKIGGWFYSYASGVTRR